MTPRRPDWWRFYLGMPAALRGAEFICWELYRLVMRDEFGVLVTDFGALRGDENETAQARRLIAENLPGWRKAEWEEGAGVLFNMSGIPSHIGIATATRGVLLHASRGNDVTTLDIRLSLNQGWKNRLVGCYLPLV